MPRGVMKLVAVLQLSRTGLMLTAVSNIWVVAALSRATGEGGGQGLSWWGYGLATAAVAGGMYTFGMVLNDVLDMRRDRLFAPQRPLPSRRIRPATAVGIAVGSLLVALTATLPLGTLSTLAALITGGLILFYDGPGKYLTGLGILTLGLVRAGNMLVADPGIIYLWPAWLTMTHVVALSALCHRLEDKRPALTGPQIWIVTLGWAFVSVVMIVWMSERGGLALPGRPWVWSGPIVAAVVFSAGAVRAVRGAASRASEAQAGQRPLAAGALLMKWGLLWLIVYDVAWLAGAELWGPAAAVALLLPASYGLMTGVRMLKTWGEGPPGFER